MTNETQGKQVTPQPLSKLTLLDRFLFAQVMEDAIVNQTILEIILGEELCIKKNPETEKEFRTVPGNRSIRIDVYTIDEVGNVYDAEVQKKNTGNIPRRTRFYQALIDCNMMAPGTVDFGNLKNVYVIIIAPFDLFGKGRYQYTFRAKCEEVKDLSLEDGAVRIFLNTRGTIRDGEREELIELLHYIEHANGSSIAEISGERLREIHRRIQAIRASEEMEVRYMQLWEEQEMVRLEGLAEGRECGRKVALLTLIQKKSQKGMKPGAIAELLEEPEDLVQQLYELIQLHPEEPVEELSGYL